MFHVVNSNSTLSLRSFVEVGAARDAPQSYFRSHVGCPGIHLQAGGNVAVADGGESGTDPNDIGRVALCLSAVVVAINGIFLVRGRRKHDCRSRHKGSRARI